MEESDGNSHGDGGADVDRGLGADQDGEDDGGDEGREGGAGVEVDELCEDKG